jgi:hypothetical protein
MKRFPWFHLVLVCFWHVVFDWAFEHAQTGLTGTLIYGNHFIGNRIVRATTCYYLFFYLGWCRYGKSPHIMYICTVSGTYSEQVSDFLAVGSFYLLRAPLYRYCTVMTTWKRKPAKTVTRTKCTVQLYCTRKGKGIISSDCSNVQ